MSRIKVWVQPFKDRPALQLQWINEKGERKTKSTGTADPDEAEQKRADKEYELNHGLHSEPLKVTWEAFRAAFEAEYLSARRPNTRRNYERTLDLFEQHCKPSGLASVSARTLSQFIAAMRAAGRKPNSLALYAEQLRAALRWAALQGMIAVVPAVPPVNVPKKRPQPVPAEIFDRLRSRILDPQLLAFALCGWLAGMRRDEAYALSWEQGDSAPWVDLDRRRIIFPADAVKGCEDEWVPLDPQLQEALLALPRHGPPVFSFGVTSQSVVRRIVVAARLAGVRLDFRALRRGFACRYAAKVPAQVLQRLCRHASIETTLAHYASFEGAIEDAVFGVCDRSGNSAAKSARIPGNS